MGFRQPVRRSTLADANERRDWRIHAALAQRLITQARTLYIDEELGLDLTNTVYALDSTTIALCLSVFPWAHFRTTKAAVKMHTLLDLRGNIPSFIHISDGKLHDVHALDMLLPEAGAIYVVDRGYGLDINDRFDGPRSKSRRWLRRSPLSWGRLTWGRTTARPAPIQRRKSIGQMGHY